MRTACSYLLVAFVAAALTYALVPPTSPAPLELVAA